MEDAGGHHARGLSLATDGEEAANVDGNEAQEEDQHQLRLRRPDDGVVAENHEPHDQRGADEGAEGTIHHRGLANRAVRGHGEDDLQLPVGVAGARAHVIVAQGARRHPEARHPSGAVLTTGLSGQR
eukprot:scaffold2316_cov218-Pinguiococcus_pyrenoidosus.AAC.4